MNNFAKGEHALTTSRHFYPDTKFVELSKRFKLPMAVGRYTAASHSVNKIVTSINCSSCWDWFTVVAPLVKTSWFCPWCGEVVKT